MDGATAQRAHGRDVEEREEALAKRWPWLLPLAAGIFIGAAGIEMIPEALKKVGAPAWAWTGAGLAAFVAVRYGLDYLGEHPVSELPDLPLLHGDRLSLVEAIGAAAPC